MALWNVLKALWRWLWHGAGFSVDELARRLGWSVADLAAFAPVYREFDVIKRTGGKRRLCAPEAALKSLQRRILRRLLRRLKVHAAATGFEPGQSIVTHARRHVGHAVVVRLDVKNFFPSTTAARVYAYFRHIGWNRPAAGLLTRLCTHHGGLPQGAPTSPRLSNLVNYRLDARLAGMARKLGVHYSRYADDITLSFPTDNRDQVRFMIRFVRRVVNDDGYSLHGAKKLRIRRRHQQQRVTGLVVNDAVNLPRAVRRRLRAVEHRLRVGRPATMTAEQLAGWRALEHMVATQTLTPEQARQAERERDGLQGTWHLVAVHEHGVPIAPPEFADRFAGLTWTFAADNVILDRAGSRIEARFRVNPRRTPRLIDLTPTTGPVRGRTQQGIYDLQQDVLKVCLNFAKGPRPVDFAPNADCRSMLLVLERARPVDTGFFKRANK